MLFKYNVVVTGVVIIPGLPGSPLSPTGPGSPTAARPGGPTNQIV